MQNFLLTHCFNICMKKDFSKKKECVRIQGGWKGGKGGPLPSSFQKNKNKCGSNKRKIQG